MTENFTFNAPQFVDFSSGLNEEDVQFADAYFEIDHEECTTTTGTVKDVDDNERNLDQEFASVEGPEQETSVPKLFLQNKLRRSMSTGNILPVEEKEEKYITQCMGKLNVGESENVTTSVKNVRKSRAGGLSRISRTKSASREALNKLAQPKAVAGFGNYRSTAETITSYQNGLRGDGSFKPNRIGCTFPKSPTLKTKDRAKPRELHSMEGQAVQGTDDVKKYKIKAKATNLKIFNGPIKAQVSIENKAPTGAEPLKSATSQAAQGKQVEDYKFHARPVPKAVLEGPKLPVKQRVSMLPHSSDFPKRLTKQRSLDHVDCAQSNKSAITEPSLISFEERNKQLKKRKEEYINKVLEQEKKAREFHARPPPKFMHQSSQCRLNQSHIKETKSNDTINKQSGFGTESLVSTFKARPAAVLHVKPFQPKKEERPLVEITEFQLNTDRRAKQRELFEHNLKEKEERLQILKKEEEERQAAIEQEQIAAYRKQAQHKAQPIRHFKEIVIEKNSKVTIPNSPKFLTDERRRNKENLC